MINCKSYVQEQKERIKEMISGTRVPKLLIMQIGDNPASNKYVAGKLRDCAEVGIEATLLKFDKDDDFQYVYEAMMIAIEQCSGAILQLPLPDSWQNQEEELLSLIPPHKDVDGLRRDSLFQPCTPAGIMMLLKEYLKLNLEGMRVTVVGKGQLVGMPLVPMLMRAGATVTACNSKTKALGANTKYADIIITATGRPGLITPDMVQPHTIIIDAGIAFDEIGMCGDCDRRIYDYCDAVTTVPGGVGLLTRLALLLNVMEADE